jgi:hypothetical protein
VLLLMHYFPIIRIQNGIFSAIFLLHVNIKKVSIFIR